MKVRNAQILEAVEHQNKTFLCRIKVVPRYMLCYNGETYKTYRWMQTEHWNFFDLQLEKLLNGLLDAGGVLHEFEERQVQLNAIIQMRVRKSKEPVELLCNSFGELKLKQSDVACALDCEIEYRDDTQWSVATDKAIDNKFQYDDCEYEPQFISSQTMSNGSDIEQNVVSYVPYTPTAKLDSSADSDVVHEERYSPKPLSGHNSSSSITKVSPSVPVYNAAPIGAEKICAKSSVHSDAVNTHDRDVDPNAVASIVVKQMQQNDVSKKHKKISNKKVERSHKMRKTPSLANEATAEAEEDDETSKATRGAKSKTKYADRPQSPNILEQSDENVTSNCSNNANKDTDDWSSNSPPRRSARSPVKPVRLIEEKSPIMLRKRMKSDRAERYKAVSKSTNKLIKNMFGSEDDDDGNELFDVRSTPKTPANKQTAATPLFSSSKKQKRKRTDECEKEKTTMNQWLSKETSNSKSNNATTLLSKQRHADGITTKKRKNIQETSATSPREESEQTTVYMSKKEMEERMSKEKLQIEQNLKVKELLEEWAGPPPAKVDTLTLNELNVSDILNSFTTHKAVLDEIFSKSRKKANVRSNDGIDHYLVMRLIDHDKQLKMMNMLEEVYDKQRDGLTAYAPLFANAMMPEWIICIFMSKFNLTRDEAIKQVKAQEDYKLHLEAQLDNSILTTNC